MAKGISIKNNHPRSQQKSLLLRRLRAGRDRQGVATSVRSLTDNVFREFGSVTRWSRGRVDRNTVLPRYNGSIENHQIRLL